MASSRAGTASVQYDMHITRQELSMSLLYGMASDDRVNDSKKQRVGLWKGVDGDNSPAATILPPSGLLA